MAPVFSKFSCTPMQSRNAAIGFVSAVGLMYWLVSKRKDWSSRLLFGSVGDHGGGGKCGSSGRSSSGQPLKGLVRCHFFHFLMFFVLGWSYRYGRTLKVDEVSLLTGQKTQKKDRAHLDKVFLQKLVKILKIIVPGWTSPESFYMVLVAFCLLIRTYADMWLISNGTSIERSIISRERDQFLKFLLKFVCAMPVIAVINNVLKYGLCELKLRFRYRLSSHLLDQYMGGFTYYKMSNLDNRICNADQLLTQDVEKFSDSIAEVYSSLCKPILDIIIYTNKLSGSIGAQGPIKLAAYLVVAGLVMSRIRRPIGRLTITEQRLEGEFRFVNSRIIVNSEEIAFYRGGKREKATLDLSFQQLINHLRKSIQFKFVLGLLESVVGKYAATIVGYIAISRPFLDAGNRLHTFNQSDRLEEYYRSGRMLIKMAEAIGRLVLAGREMTRLAGFTSRVSELVGVIEDLKKGRYERTMISDSNNSNCNGVTAQTKSKRCDLIPGRGRVIFQDNIIRFDHVPLVTPNGDILIQDLNFEVQSGMNVLVCGPNGCGKSSLFRILGELWPLFGGVLTKPEMSKLFYIPQKPYMTLGTLRDQLIYPDSHQDQIRKGITDADLVEFLDIVQLSYILDREGGLEAVQDWIDVLSGGEKQRVAMARLFYHKPQFAILDECTSAVSVDVEAHLYQYCRKVGITLFTVSHRKSLWTHHEFVLQMDGRGSYIFEKIDDATKVYGS